MSEDEGTEQHAVSSICMGEGGAIYGKMLW